MTLILASGSTIRRTMLLNAGLTFEVVPSAVDEVPIKRAGFANGLLPGDVALQLAALKALEVSASWPDAIVIGADQILECCGLWFDKPATLPDAGAHLHTLQGRTHHLATAVVCAHRSELLFQHVENPSLTMRALSDRSIADYLSAEGDALFGSVGGYLIESSGIRLFNHVQGDYFAILGMPLTPLLNFLDQIGELGS